MNNLDYPIPVLELVTALKQLPGIGTRGAERMALWMLQGHMGEAEAIARTIGQAAEHVTPCPVCGFFSTEGEPCVACRDEERDSRLICVVEQATDVIPIERSSAYRGLYHCLGGKLSPLDDVEPEDLNIQSLMERVSRQPDCEVILATGSDVEGEATATYLHHLLKEMDCRISRPAQGLPAGSGLSHADTLTLMKALEGRIRLLRKALPASIPARGNSRPCPRSSPSGIPSWGQFRFTAVFLPRAMPLSPNDEGKNSPPPSAMPSIRARSKSAGQIVTFTRSPGLSSSLREAFFFSTKATAVLPFGRVARKDVSAIRSTITATACTIWQG